MSVGCYRLLTFDFVKVRHEIADPFHLFQSLRERRPGIHPRYRNLRPTRLKQIQTGQAVFPAAELKDDAHQKYIAAARISDPIPLVLALSEATFAL